MRSVAAAVCFWVSGFTGGIILASVVHGNTRLIPLYTISASTICVSGLLMQFGTPRRRYARIALALVLFALAASPAGAGQIFTRNYDSATPGLEGTMPAGVDFAFRVTADSGPTFDWTWELPTPPNGCCIATKEFKFTAANAAAAGLDLSALATALTGNRGQGTQWGAVGHELATPYILQPAGFLNVQAIDEVRVSLSNEVVSQWTEASVSVYGTFTGLVPEPTTFALLLFGLVHITVRSRAQCEPRRRS